VAGVDELKKVKKKYTWHLTNEMWVSRQQRPSQQWGVQNCQRIKT